MKRYLASTQLLDFNSANIQNLIQNRGWRNLESLDARINAAYLFVRDEIRFGYNSTDSISASRVLSDGYGQCNTKSTLLMALLRAIGVPCRLHGATIHKRLQKGIVNGLFYALAPTNIFHTWAEVFIDGKWVGLEGVILDASYLRGLRTSLPANTTELLGFAVGSSSFDNPPVDWKGTDTQIQSTGVNQDFGGYDDPDRFYETHGDNLTSFRAWLFKAWIRHVLNRNVESIRASATAERHNSPTSPSFI